MNEKWIRENIALLEYRLRLEPDDSKSAQAFRSAIDVERAKLAALNPLA